MNQEFINRLRTAYIAELQTKKDSGDWHNDKTPEQIADMMLNAIQTDANNSNYSDWLKHNPTLKKASKKCGISTSPNLREQFFIEKEGSQ
jgi:hypothetical protein